jgi:hypothetical protein
MDAAIGCVSVSILMYRNMFAEAEGAVKKLLTVCA